MSGEIEALVDTNVLVYAMARDPPDKHARAREIVERGFRDGCYAISTQVLFELYVTLTRKLAKAVPKEIALDFVQALSDWPVVDVDAALALTAIRLSHRARISVWDAAIVEAARRIGCDLVISEDLSDGQSYEGVRVENPF